MSRRSYRQRENHIDVMLSCTSKDLEKHREQATQAVLRVGMFPHVMTSLVAGIKNPYEVSMELVNKAEVYVGIFAHRYGYIPEIPENPDRLSMTELEYRRAVERDIPRLIFVMDKSYPVLPEHYEDEEEGKEKLKALKDELQTNYTASFFTSPEDLRAQLIQALHAPDLRERALEIAGEFEAEQGDVIPRPPSLYSVPPYIQTGQFIGRARELALLDRWATASNPVKIVAAIGGQGKSALTWAWVNNRATNFDGILWWSFYERGATMNAFMRHAIAYIEQGDPDDPKYRNMKHDERKTRLLTLLQGNRYLIILDGLERILTAYHRLDNAQVRDDEVQTDLRACTDPKDSDILYKLAGCNPSKILISTRLVPRVLESHTGALINGVELEQLKGLAPTDAEALLIADGITFENTTILHRFLKQFDYHGLLLKMVAGRIKKDRRARGDFDKWYEQRGKTFDFTRMDIVQRQTSILQYAMEGLDDYAKTLLNRIAAFSDGVNFDTLEEVANPEGNLDKFDTALTELEDRGLLQWDSETDTYDLHPVVRGFAFKGLTGEERVNTYNRIYDHFNSQEYSYEVDSIEQLQIPIMIFQALVGAGRLDDAAQFYSGSFSQILLFKLIAYPTTIQLLQPFFPDGIDQPPRLTNKSNQSYIMNDMAIAYQLSGDSLRGLSLCGQVLESVLEQRHIGDIIVGLRNYGDMAGEANRLFMQFQAVMLNMDYAQATGAYLERAYAWLFRAYSRQSDWVQAEKMQAKLTEVKDSFYYYYQAEMHFQRGQDPTAMLEQTIGYGRSTLAIMWVYGLYILYYLQVDDIPQAIHYAEEAIKLARRSGSAYLARYLARLARVKAKQGLFDDAISLINEAWRGTVVKFDEAELYNSATEVYRAMGDTDKATENAVNAYEIAWADGPPYINWYELETAKAHLDALGVPYPDMPAFDESKMDKLPYEDELRAYLEELKKEKAEKEDNNDAE